MSDKELLSVMRQRGNYFKFCNHVKEAQVDAKTHQILADLEGYFKDESRQVVDWNEFSQWFLMVKHPMYSHAQQEVYRTHFKLLAEAPSNEGLEEQIVAAFLERSIAAAIALIADQVADGSERLSLVDVDARMEEWHKAQSNLDDADEEDWEMGELVDLIDGKGGTRGG